MLGITMIQPIPPQEESQMWTLASPGDMEGNRDLCCPDPSQRRRKARALWLGLNTLPQVSLCQSQTGKKHKKIPGDQTKSDEK